jgi:predicted Fe-Mo cluster-binding NifX family protein
MRIAIATFGIRVSPRFDCAQTVLIVTVADGREVEREELLVASWAPHERARKLAELGVEAVICGGIDCWSANSLLSQGMTVYGWVAGHVEDALAAVLRGDLDALSSTPRRGGFGRRGGDGNGGLRVRQRRCQRGLLRGGGAGQRRRSRRGDADLGRWPDWQRPKERS